MSMRVLSRVGTHELMPEEADRVRGAGCKNPTYTPVTSLFPPVVDGMVLDCS